MVNTAPVQPTPPYSLATHQTFTPTPPVGPPPPPNMFNQATIPHLFQQLPTSTQATAATDQTVIVQQSSNQQ